MFFALISDNFHTVLKEVYSLHQVYASVLDVGLLIFARLMGFMLSAPIFGRKDLPFNIKMGLAMAVTWILLPQLPLTAAQKALVSLDDPITYSIQIGLNVTIGLIIGFIADCIMQAISSAGSLMNNQIGLSSAMLFDPSTREQVAIVDKLFSYLGMMLFFQLGGMYWLLNALNRSLHILPVYQTHPDIVGKISLNYLILVSGNCLEIGMILVAPIMVVTMAVDLILGIVNRTAQQIQVFQLSFALKPCIGIAAFLLTFPIFLHLVENYLTDYAPIF